MNEHKVIIIAEAGVNHNGDLKKAFALIDVAVDAGADYVKFQTFKAEKIVSPVAKMASYQHKNMGSQDDSQFNMLKKLELSDRDHQELCQYAKQRNISFFSTAFDVEGIQYLDGLGLDRFKIPSGELTNYPYLRAVGKIGKPVILSTGMASMNEIELAIEVLMQYGINREKLTVLHCNTEYPTPMEDVNLKAMQSIAKSLKVAVGYSDHTLGIEVPIAAVALGATIIEKHFTLDRSLPGPDHKASLEPQELKAMVSAVRNVEKAIAGSGEKVPSASEKKNITIARKSIHLSKALNSGETITEECLIALRPGDGISPMEWERIIDKTMVHNREALHKLTWQDFL